ERDLGDRGRGVARLARAAAQLGRGVGVEVAVPAAHRAERDVQVDAERRRRRARHAGAAHFFAVSLPPPASEDSAATNASWGTSTRPMFFIRFLPSFCFSSSLRLRLMSPP